MWTVRTATASASGSRSAVAGSSPASISVWRWPATNIARSSASSADWARMMSKKRATLPSPSSAAVVGVRASRASIPLSRRKAYRTSPAGRSWAIAV